jgi:hypothetical protein
MKINSNIEKGNLNLKIYNDNKVLFEKNGSINEVVTVQKNDSRNLKIKITGKKS